MSCKSAVNIANTSSTNVATNANIPLGTIQRRYGCALNATGNGIQLNAPGYYLVTASITFTAPATGVVSVTLQQDGVSVNGATAADTVTTALTEQNSISLNTIVRVFNGSAPDVLTLLNTGIAFTPSNISVSVIKI